MEKTDVVDQIEWARQTITDKEMFGLDPLNAGFARERRARGALLSAKQEILKLREEIKDLKEIIDVFIVHSNGLSIWARMPSKRENLPKDVGDDIQDLYDYQCHVEKIVREQS